MLKPLDSAFQFSSELFWISEERQQLKFLGKMKIKFIFSISFRQCLLQLCFIESLAIAWKGIWKGLIKVVAVHTSPNTASLACWAGFSVQRATGDVTVAPFPESVPSAKIASTGSSCETDCTAFMFMKRFSRAPLLLLYGLSWSIMDYLVCWLHRNLSWQFNRWERVVENVGKTKVSIFSSSFSCPPK